MSFSEPRSLIVIYKHEMLVNQLKKLIYTNDDIDEDNIIGVKDTCCRGQNATKRNGIGVNR